MAKRKSSSDRETQTVTAADVGTVESVLGDELTPPAAPAATETSPEQAEAPAELAGPAAPPAGDETPAPPASADGSSDVREGADVGKVIDGLADQMQELLEKQAEEEQPKPPVLDRVLARLSKSIDEPHRGYASTSPEVTLPGELAELNAKLFDAMLAEGVPCSRQGDTHRFLLEQLGESLRRF